MNEIERKHKELRKTIENLDKKFGDNSVIRLDGKSKKVETISSGSLALDYALGVNGLPRGRIIDIYGEESSGKSLLSILAVAEAQKQGGIACYIDVEGAFNAQFAEINGINLNDLYLSQPNNGEEALDIAFELLNTGYIDLMVIDSTAALIPRIVIEESMNEQNIGIQARLISKGLQKLLGVVKNTKCVLVFIDQLRTQIGKWGDPMVATGGLALRFYSSVRIRIKKADIIKENDRIVGQRIKAFVTKNKVAPPFGKATIDLYYSNGIDKVEDAVQAGLMSGVIERVSKVKYKIEDKEFIGIENLKNAVKTNEELFKMLREMIKNA
ncbi:MAG: recombinase RecA [Promethearchaeota archaeon]